MIYGFDYLKRYTGDGEGYYDENGDWIMADGEWGAPIQCDIEHPSSGRATILRDEAGAATEYSYIVWLDQSVASFKLGERVLLCVGGEPETEYTVKGFRRFRTLCKLWL